MDTNEMLVRTMNAAKEARERGFFKTADAFDEIVESLLDLLESHAHSQHDGVIETVPEVHHMNWANIPILLA